MSRPYQEIVKWKDPVCEINRHLTKDQFAALDMAARTD